LLSGAARSSAKALHSRYPMPVMLVMVLVWIELLSNNQQSTTAPTTGTLP
jgi:hypothetical protein